MLNFSTGFRNNLLEGVGVNEQFADGSLLVYAGTQPANADAASGDGGTATLLCNIDLPTSAEGNPFDTAANGAVVNIGTWDGTATVADTAAWFRLIENGGDPDTADTGGTEARIDGDIAPSDAALIMGDPDVQVSDTLIVDPGDLTINIPAVECTA